MTAVRVLFFQTRTLFPIFEKQQETPPLPSPLWLRGGGKNVLGKNQELQTYWPTIIFAIKLSLSYILKIILKF